MLKAIGAVVVFVVIVVGAAAAIILAASPRLRAALIEEVDRWKSERNDSKTPSPTQEEERP